jgi:hypothetical protein
MEHLSMDMEHSQQQQEEEEEEQLQESIQWRRDKVLELSKGIYPKFCKFVLVQSTGIYHI